MMEMNNLLQIVESQNAIIRIQSSVIDELFQLLMQHISTEELENLRTAKLDQVTRIRAEIGMD